MSEAAEGIEDKFLVLTSDEMPVENPDERSGKYLIFRLASSDFAIGVKQVREVIEMQEITRVPNAPEFIAGVINLRGKVIPVVDLRVTLDPPLTTNTAHTSIIVSKVALSSTEQVLGLVVDAVIEVLHLHDADFLRPEAAISIPDLSSSNPASCLLGAARVEGQVKFLLDLDEVIKSHALHRAPVLSAAA